MRAPGLSLNELNTSARYVIDSFPVAVCRNCRIPVCKLLTEKTYRGYNEAKKEYFYGFKVQLLMTAEGLPVDYYVTAGSFHDATMHLGTYRLVASCILVLEERPIARFAFFACPPERRIIPPKR